MLLACTHVGGRPVLSEPVQKEEAHEASASRRGRGGAADAASPRGEGSGGLGDEGGSHPAEGSRTHALENGGTRGVQKGGSRAGGSADRVERGAASDKAKSTQSATPAVLAPGTLTPCSAKALDAKGATAISVSVMSHLEGCPFRVVQSSRLVGHHVLSDTKVPLFQVFTEREPLVRELECGARPTFGGKSPFRGPRIDTDQNTYAVFYDVIRSSEQHELVFAVDDGHSVHLGVQVSRVCQGVAPHDVMTSTVFVVPGPGRSVVLHRCAPRIPSCGPIP
nr:MAG: hypothetical protein DIU78_13635 [Pseudomonadota bacterium]